MKMPAILFLILTCFMYSGRRMDAQVKYDRSAISFVFLNTGESGADAIRNQWPNIELPERFFYNVLDSSTLFPGIRRVAPLDYFFTIPKDTLQAWMYRKQLDRQLLAEWFDRRPEGGFTLDVLKERGLYNANDAEYLQAIASRRGETALMDMGLKLIGQSYIVVFDFYHVQSFAEYYDQNRTPRKDRDKRGYRAQMRAYVFRLDFNEKTAVDFFEKYWTQPGAADTRARMESFDKATFPLVFVSQHMHSLEVSQGRKGLMKLVKEKSKEAQMAELAGQALELVLRGLGAADSALQVKAMISHVRPVRAKIGKKEDVRFEQRFFAYENIEDKKGNIKAKRRGVLKAYRIADNRHMAEGQTVPSSFYQIGGRRLDATGMYLRERRDWGLNAAVGLNLGGKQGVQYRLEYYLSKKMGWMVRSGKSGKAITSFKVYTEFGGYKEYDWFFGNVSYRPLSAGFQKDFYPARWWHWGPYWGIGFEDASWASLNGGYVSMLRMEYGIRAGLNFRHNIQLMLGYNYFQQVGEASQYDSGRDYQGVYYGSAFENRLGSGFSLGLRLML
jgi:hypothetical protein